MPLWSLFLKRADFLIGTGLLVGLLFPVEAQKPRRFPCTQTLGQGIRGTVLLQTGNQMPSPDRPSRAPSGVRRKVAVFPLLYLSRVRAEGNGFFSKLKQKALVQGFSDDKGCIQFALPPGRYSVMVWEKGKWYANSYGLNGEIFELEVKPNAVEAFEFRISHSASF